MTPVMYAARDGHPQVVALLVAHGAEVNAQDENGYTVRFEDTTFLLALRQWCLVSSSSGPQKSFQK